MIWKCTKSEIFSESFVTYWLDDKTSNCKSVLQQKTCAESWPKLLDQYLYTILGIIPVVYLYLLYTYNIKHKYHINNTLPVV